MAIPGSQPPRWHPLPLRRYWAVEMFRYAWNMGNKADFGQNYPEIDWAEAELIWVELGYDTEQQAAG